MDGPTRPAGAAPATAGGGRRRRVPWWAIALGVLALLVAAACVRWPVPTGLAERVLSQRLERSVDIEGRARFCLCPHPWVRLERITIGAPDWSDAPHFATLADAEVELGWSTLFGGRPRIRSARVGSGDVIAERTEDGRASWQFGTKPADEPGPPAEGPVIDRLEASDVTWTLRDPGTRIDLKGTLQLVDGEGAPGREAETPSLRVEAKGTVRGLPTEARVDGGGVLPSASSEPRPLKARASVGEGRFEFDGSTSSLASLDGLDGAYRVRGPALAALGALVGAVLPRTPPFSIEGRVRNVESRWEVEIAQARVGESDLRGQVNFTPAKDRASSRLEGSLASKRMRIVDLGRSVGFGEGEPDTKKRPGRVLPDVSLDLPSLQSMDARVDLKIETLELGDLAPVTGLGARLQLEGGVLAVGQLAAQVAGGKVGGEVRIDGSQSPGRTAAKLTMREISMQRWLPKLRGEPPMTSRLNAEVSIQGRGDSVADVLAKADGRVRVALGPGDASRLVLEVAGLDIAESLLSLAGGERRIKLDCGLVDIAIKDGIATPAAFYVDTRDTVLTAEGRIDLGTEKMDLKVRALPRDFSPLTVRSPLVIGGTFGDPEFGLDRTRVAGTVIASAVLGAVVAPLAALLPLLDFGEDVPSPCRDRFAADAKGLAPKPAATKDKRK